MKLEIQLGPVAGSGVSLNLPNWRSNPKLCPISNWQPVDNESRVVGYYGRSSGDLTSIQFNSYIIIIALLYRQPITRGPCTALEKLKKVDIRKLYMFHDDH